MNSLIIGSAISVVAILLITKLNPFHGKEAKQFNLISKFYRAITMERLIVIPECMSVGKSANITIEPNRPFTMKNEQLEFQYERGALDYEGAVMFTLENMTMKIESTRGAVMLTEYAADLSNPPQSKWESQELLPKQRGLFSGTREYALAHAILAECRRAVDKILVAV